VSSESRPLPPLDTLFRFSSEEDHGGRSHRAHLPRMIFSVAGVALSTAAILKNVEFVPVDPSVCYWDFGNTSFNANPLKTTSFWYVNDNENNQNSRNFTYFFNVCGNIPSDANVFPRTAACNTTYPGYNYQNMPQSGPSMAFQYNNMDTSIYDKCHRLAGSATSSNIGWALIDPTNPSFGYVMQYLGGDQCYSQTGSLIGQRTLRLWFVCDKDFTNVPDDEVVLEAPSTCVYDIYIKTIAGCPTGCPTPMVYDPATKELTATLCGNHGICSYDGALKNSRCFCNDGWTGSDCTQLPSTPPTGLSTLGGVLIGIGILLALLIAGLVYLWLRIRALRLDPTAYSSLRGGPGEGDLPGLGSVKGDGIQ
jgi:hypothetical protein